MPLSAFVIWLVVNIVYFLINAISASKEKNAYRLAIQAYDTQSEILENYYISIANSYSVIGSNESAMHASAFKDIKSAESALKEYERIHALRVEKKAGGKSWGSLVLLCIFLGWMGAHRFYVGKIGTGILMLIKIPSGISIIWAIIDLILIFSGKFTDRNKNEIRLLKQR